MSPAVIFQVRGRDVEVRLGRMVRACGQFAPEFQGAKIGRILKPQEMLVKRIIGDAQCEFARLTGLFAHREGIFTH